MTVPIDKNMPRLSRDFFARLEAFDEIKALIDKFGIMSDLGPEDRYKLTLIVEELFTNTVNHGHGGDCDASVSISLEQNHGQIQLIYEDSAPPFDPLAAGQRTDIESTINERRVGGLGILITIGLTERVDYSYVEGRNRITLRLTVMGN
jgi:anti-sigma regulatory factor (Ser/Thr protein kinase)